MPATDSKGQALAVGDQVVIRAKVASVDDQDQDSGNNCIVEFAEKAPDRNAPAIFRFGVNTKVLDKV